MLKRSVQILSGLWVTAISGVSLLVSLVIKAFGVDTPLYLDPSWLAVILSGLPLLYHAIRKIIYNKGIAKISSALLISIAMVAAVVIKDVFAAGEVAFIMAIGGILEDWTTARARKGLKNLLSLTPTMGRKLIDGQEIILPATEIVEGDILRVFPGERIPVDGVVIAGSSSVNQAIMTGESLPVDKEIGDQVFCGTTNCFGAIDVRASKVGEDSSLQKLIQMVQEADKKKAPIQRIADRWASILVPIALLIAVVAWILLQDILVAVTILVVFCPCALVLATPTAIMAAIGQATKQGVVIKSGEALEKMTKTDVIAFDKTGTLTKGILQVEDVVPFGQTTAKQLLLFTATAESKSEHPLGKAIVAHAKAQECVIGEADNFIMQAGKGVQARCFGEQIFCGNITFLAGQGISIPQPVQAQAQAFSSQGKGVVLVAKNQEIIGIITLLDSVREGAKEVVQRLKDNGARVALLTGDNQNAAVYLAQKVGIDEVYAELLPEQKVQQIQALQNQKARVCMIGDGVNDAPALKTADVGVAMGTMGSDVAVEAAEIALTGDDLRKIPYLQRLAKGTKRTIKFGILLSLSINFVAIALSLLGVLNPTTGALVHNGGSFLVILIAALLYERKFDK